MESKDRPTEPQESIQLARLDPQALIESAIQHNSNIETLERLVALATQVREIQAKEAWLSAMAHFQEQCPAVLKTKLADTGRFKYRYAPLDRILAVVQPVMGPLGLSVSFRRRQEQGKVIVICRISHAMGHHEESGEVIMPILPPSEKGATPHQLVAIADTYAMRYAFRAISGIIPEDDESILAEEAQQLKVEMPRRSSERQEPPEPGSEDGPGPDPAAGRLISEKQRKRLWAIAYGAGKNLDLGKQEINDKVKAIIGLHGYDSTDDITEGRYDQIIKDIEAWGEGA